MRNRNPLFNPKHTAQIVRSHLLSELNELQQRILLVERFGEDAVPYPRIQTTIPSVSKLEDMLADHRDLVEKIKLLTKAIDKADEREIAEMVASIKARNGL